MDLIILNDGMYQLVPLTKQMMEHMSLLVKEINCFDLCDIVRLKLTTFVDSLNAHVMNDDSGYFFGCICN
jgi:NADP-dependent 3-hydroxy acid dehydrogenase YdfG